MAVSLISHPFRITPTGAVATRDDGTADYYSERLALLILTKPGERVLVPSYGIQDPAFQGLLASVLQSQVETFGPRVKIESVESKFVSDTRQDVVVTFDENFADQEQ